MARNIYPGVFRKEFGFERWKDFDAELLQQIYDDDSQEREFSHRIYGYDLNYHAVEAALKNVRSAGVDSIVQVQQQDFRKFTRPEQPAIMVTNPPYGERLTPPDLISLYQTIGKSLKHEFSGGEAWIISSKEELFENIGLRASLKVQIFNGKIDCDFRKYQLFEGKLGQYRAEGGEVKTDEERRLMSDRTRFRTRRDEFKQRITGDEEPRMAYESDDDLDPEYLLLRRKHREFQDSRFAPRTPRPAGKRSEGRTGGAPRKGGPRRDGDARWSGGRGGTKKEGYKRDAFRKGGPRRPRRDSE